MRALLVGDVHLSDRPPSSRTDTYTQDILDKLSWIVDYANQNADYMVLLGDVFHLKTPSRTSHALVQKTADILSQFKSRVLIVPGNHDLSQDRLDSIPSQPLGTLALTHGIDLIDGYDDETRIVGIPYLNDQEVFHSYLEGLEAEPIDPPPVLIVTHASIFPPEDHPPYEHMNADEIETGGVPLAYGHIHIPHGFYLVNDSWFCNNGAISRGSLHEETLHRQLAVTLFDTESAGCPFTSIPIPFKPPEQVFRLVEHHAKEAKAAKLDEFIQSIDQISLTSLSLEEVMAHAEASLTPDARHELRTIMESVIG